jgi:hypothetical protein
MNAPFSYANRDAAHLMASILSRAASFRDRKLTRRATSMSGNNKKYEDNGKKDGAMHSDKE